MDMDTGTPPLAVEEAEEGVPAPVVVAAGAAGTEPVARASRTKGVRVVTAAPNARFATGRQEAQGGRPRGSQAVRMHAALTVPERPSGALRDVLSVVGAVLRRTLSTVRRMLVAGGVVAMVGTPESGMGSREVLRNP